MFYRARPFAASPNHPEVRDRERLKQLFRSSDDGWQVVTGLRQKTMRRIKPGKLIWRCYVGRD